MKRTTDVTYGGRIIPVPGYGMGGLHPPPTWEHGDPHPNVNIGALTLHPNENVGATTPHLSWNMSKIEHLWATVKMLPTVDGGRIEPW
jgi:hypothetical protein